jgi:hypothetical protein
VLDNADNCPLAKNPEQLDPNGNGQGMACDESDEDLLLGGMFEILMPVGTFEIGLPQPGGGIGYLPESLFEEIVLEMPHGFRAAIVDSEGMWVAQSFDTGT